MIDPAGADVLFATCRDLPRGGPDAALLTSALVSRGIAAGVAAWDDPAVDWTGAPLTVIRSTWDYHLDRDRFLVWAESVPELHNPRSLVGWNTDKRYLLELPASVPVVPTVVLEDPRAEDVAGRLAERDWSDAVLKPAIGLDGHGVVRVSRGISVAPRSGVWLLQPFVSGAVDPGEMSVMFIEGRATHAVLRKPSPGDFRSQERLGGRVEPVDPPDAVVELACAAVEWIRPAPLYARVDVVLHGDGPRVMELELVEPALFLAFSDPAVGALLDAIERRLG